MTTWLALAVLAQLLSALTVFIDKYVLVTPKGITHPSAFAFFTALLSGSVLILLPFGVVGWPTFEVAFLSLASALVYITSLLFLYRALSKLSVTDVIPITAAAGAIMTGILAALFLSADLPASSLPAFVLLTAGTFLIYCFCFPLSLLLMTIASGALVGVSTFLVKIIFESTNFVDALFWPLAMNAIVALVVLAPARWHAIRETFRESSHGAKGMVIVSKALGGISFLLTFVALALGSVTIVNAMGGLQLIFLFLLVPLFAHRLPHIFKADLRVDRLLLKIAGAFCIVMGLGALFLF